MKIELRILLSIVLLLAMQVMVWPVQAASFDCAKARRKVEKLICHNPRLSALDDQLAKQYSEALKQAKNPLALRKRQRAWLKQLRKYCTTEICVGGAYIARIHAIEDGDGAKVYDTPALLAEREADKASKIKAILTQHTSTDYPMTLNTYALKPAQIASCGHIYAALRSGASSVKFVEPVLRTNDPTNPALGDYLACDYEYIKPIDPALHFSMLDFGSTGFRLYRFHPSANPYGKVSEYLYGENPKDTFRTSTAALVKVDFQTCNILDSIPLYSSSPITKVMPIYGTNALILYRRHYYFLDLERIGNTDVYYRLNLYPYSQAKRKFLSRNMCAWSTPIGNE